jgi:hypothetical protein
MKPTKILWIIVGVIVVAIVAWQLYSSYYSSQLVKYQYVSPVCTASSGYICKINNSSPTVATLAYGQRSSRVFYNTVLICHITINTTNIPNVAPKPNYTSLGYPNSLYAYVGMLLSNMTYTIGFESTNLTSGLHCPLVAGEQPQLGFDQGIIWLSYTYNSSAPNPSTNPIQITELGNFTQ